MIYFDEFSGFDLTDRQKKVIKDYTAKVKPGVWVSFPGACLCCKDNKHGQCLYPGLCMCACRNLSKKQRKKLQKQDGGDKVENEL